MNSFLTSGLIHAAFWVVVGLTFGGAVLAVFPRKIVYNVLGLIVCLSGVAGLFLYLGSFFLALMQLLIYVGAICVAIVFAIMLSPPLHLEVPKRRMGKVVLSAGASGVFFVAIAAVIWKTVWHPAAERGADWSIVTIGHLLLTRYDLVFELISLVLLVAIIGAILTTGFSRRLSS
ncbi:NADH dehydrogenase subunit J [Desulfacinum hydrothermale DSM 13146]|uniref:NADH-quinone oxidoreductase subunit J n=1 Tax=Desulfacinum hydrothermale DSM 13146 TaxID=1121390 RepID=A0A1W1XP05_9BACT|nr:NADH-quinone oxidoreductase subunit J [Desulfacinum hydrothermale]SMC25248.1 NADH dehydrogenase subunit J [Desulfacinum hydrothermale DSM 13146]